MGSLCLPQKPVYDPSCLWARCLEDKLQPGFRCLKGKAWDLDLKQTFKKKRILRILLPGKIILFRNWSFNEVCSIEYTQWTNLHKTGNKLFGVLNCSISEPMAATLTPPFINLEVCEKFLVDSVSAFLHNGDKITFVFVLNKIHYSFPKVWLFSSVKKTHYLSYSSHE